VALSLVGLFLISVVGTLTMPFAFIAVIRSFAARFGGPVKSTEGPEANYDDGLAAD
jgi:hypothetical protein